MLNERWTIFPPQLHSLTSPCGIYRPLKVNKCFKYPCQIDKNADFLFRSNLEYTLHYNQQVSK